MDKEAMEKSFNEMNALARGVGARYDLLIGYAEMVTQETNDIARHLGITEKEIQMWAATRVRQGNEREMHLQGSIHRA